MFDCGSDRYEAFLLAAAGKSSLVDCAVLALQVGGDAGDSQTVASTANGEKRLATNLLHLKRCREVTTRMRNAAPYVVPKCELVSARDTAQLERFARVAEVLTSSRQSPQQKLEDSAAVISSLLHSGLFGDDVHEILLVLLKVQQAAIAILHGEASVQMIHLLLDCATIYILANNTECSLMHLRDARTLLGQLVEQHSSKTHLDAKLLFAEALALQSSDAKRAHDCARRALDLAECLYTVSTGLGWYKIVCALTLGTLEGDHDALNARCEEVVGIERGRPTWAYLPLLKLHCDVLLRADKALRAPAVANARNRLLTALRNAATRAEIEHVEQRLRADVAQMDEKARTLKATVVRQCDRICKICETWLNSAFSSASDDNNTRSVQASSCDYLACSAFVGMIGARAALRVDRVDLSRRFAGAADRLLSPAFGPSHPLVSLNRITLGASQLFKAIPARFALVKCIAQLTRAYHDAESNGRAVAIENHEKEEAITQAIDALASTPSSEAIIALLEETLQGILSRDTSTGRDFGPLLSCIATLHAHYVASSTDKGKISQMLALWCDALSDFVGPQHPLTLSKVDEFVLHRNAILPPHFSPSGGVVPLLTPVTITCDTADADIYVAFDGDMPINAEGVNSSTLYQSPVILDRTGTITIKATTFREDGRSKCTSTRFVVTPIA